MFGEMPQRNIVSWNVLINGLIEWGQLARCMIRCWFGGWSRGLVLLMDIRKMFEVDGIEPNEVTLLAIFPAISNLGYLIMCQSIHVYV